MNAQRRKSDRPYGTNGAIDSTETSKVRSSKSSKYEWFVAEGKAWTYQRELYYKHELLSKDWRSNSCRSQFFSQRIINVWNSLPIPGIVCWRNVDLV